MRLRKDSDEMLQEEVLLIASVSDALAHPARINMFRYIMQANRVVHYVPGAATCESTLQTLSRINKTYRADIQALMKRITEKGDSNAADRRK